MNYLLTQASWYESYQQWQKRFRSELQVVERFALEYFTNQGCREEDLMFALFAFSSNEPVGIAASWDRYKAQVKRDLPMVRQLIEELNAAATKLHGLKNNQWLPEPARVSGTLHIHRPLARILELTAENFSDSVNAAQAFLHDFSAHPNMWLALLDSHLKRIGISRYLPKLASLLRPAFAAQPKRKPDYDSSTLGLYIKRVRGYFRAEFIDHLAAEIFPISLTDPT